MKMTAKFHLPGLRYNYPLNMMLLSLKEKYPHYFRDNIEIASFFGEFQLRCGMVEDSVTGISATDALWKKW